MTRINFLRLLLMICPLISLGPGSAVGGKRQKTKQIGKISASEASPAVVWGGGGKAAEPVDMPLMPPFHDTRFWYHALIGQMSLRSFNVKLLLLGKRLLKTNFEQAI